MDPNAAKMEVYDWYFGLKLPKRPSPNLVHAIEQKITSESDVNKLRALRFLLAGALADVDRFDDAETIYLALHDTISISE
jgi:hypothetical protein